jgi:hypothetical protein
MPTYTLHLHFTCRKATTWDRRLYFPSEGRRAEGANPRTWVPKASTLPLDHRSRCICLDIQCIHFIPSILLLCFALQGVNRNRNHRLGHNNLDKAFGSNDEATFISSAEFEPVIPRVPGLSPFVSLLHRSLAFSCDYRIGNIAVPT